MTEHRNTDEVTLNCSVLTNRQCPHTVKWLFENKSSAKDDEDIKTSQSTCSASVTFKTRHFIDASRNYKLLKCNVTDDNEGKVHLFAFKAQSSGKEAGESTMNVKNKLHCLIYRFDDTILFTNCRWTTRSIL